MPIARQGIGLKLLHLKKVKKDVCGLGEKALCPKQITTPFSLILP